MITSEIIVQTTPQNIASEKAAFFADPTYNPQLTYAQPIDPSDLTAWGLPQDKYVKHALRFIESNQATRTIKDPHDIVTREEILVAVADFNVRHQVTAPIKVVFSENLVAKCKVGERTIFFHVPIQYSHSQFTDLLRHELDTHLLRNLNHAQQPWKDTKVPELEIRRTEEGWAGLHTFLYREDKVLLKSYITYLAVSLAQKHSFREVFNQLRELGVSKDLAWRLCLRTKRGLQDTTQPGGLTRDICYFEGAVQVWDWLINHQNDPRDCYLGRLSLDQIPALKPQADVTKIKYPSFLEDTQKYLAHISAIGEINSFSSLT